MDRDPPSPAPSGAGAEPADREGAEAVPPARRQARTVRGGSGQRDEGLAPPPSTRLPIAGSRSGRPSRWTTQPDPDSPLYQAAIRRTIGLRARVVVLAAVLIAVLVVAIVTMTR
jgi:hypothetical protein